MEHISNASNMSRLDEPKSDFKLTWDRVLIAVTLYSIVLVTILGNVLVLVAVKVDKRLQTLFNYYLVNLAITDVAVAVTAMSFQATFIVFGRWPFGEILCAMWIFFDYGMTFVSVFTLILISVDRVWAIKWSLHYRKWHTKRKCIMSIVAVWVFMLVLWVPPWITDRLRYSRPSECYWDPSLNKEFVYIVAIFGHHGPFCIMVSLYTYVFMFMRKRSRTVGVVGSERSATPSIFPPTNSATVSGKDEQLSSRVSLNDRVVASSSKDDEAASFPEPDLSQLDVSRLQVPTSSGKRHGDGRRNKISEASTRSAMRIAREKRVFVTVSYIVIGYAILWLPFHVVFDVSIVDPTLVPVPMLNAAFWMAYINSTLNPFFYNFSCPTFRKTFRQILIRRC